MAEEPNDIEDVDAGDGAEEHRPEGLDLARALLKAAGAAATNPVKRSPRKGARSFRRRGRGEAQFSGSGPDGRDPQLLGGELSRMIEERGWGLDLQVRGVFGRWREIVGPEIGEHSTPETLVDGVLVVRTESTAWATQLKLLAPTLVRRLNEELGAGTVTVVEVRGPNAPSWKHGRLANRDARGPRDTYG